MLTISRGCPERRDQSAQKLAQDQLGTHDMEAREPQLGRNLVTLWMRRVGSSFERKTTVRVTNDASQPHTIVVPLFAPDHRSYSPFRSSQADLLTPKHKE